MKLKFKDPAEGIIDKVIYGSIGMAVLFIMLSSVVLPNLNTTFNYVVTGLSATLYQGIITLVFFLALIGFAMAYIPKKK
jgi:type II secretory pathway component PulF